MPGAQLTGLCAVFDAHAGRGQRRQAAGELVILTYTRGPVSGFSPDIGVGITGYFVNLP
jgi:hypothetical protein